MVLVSIIVGSIFLLGKLIYEINSIFFYGGYWSLVCEEVISIFLSLGSRVIFGIYGNEIYILGDFLY